MRDSISYRLSREKSDSSRWSYLMNKKKIYRLIYIENDDTATIKLKQIIRTYSINSDLLINLTVVHSLPALEEEMATQGCDLVLLRHHEALPTLEEVSQLVDVTRISIFSIINAEELIDSQALLGRGAEFALTLDMPNILYKRIVDSIHNHNLRLEFREMKHELKRLQKVSEAQFSQTEDAIAYLTDGLFLTANESFLELFGIDSYETLEGLLLFDIIHHSFMNDFKTLNKSVFELNEEYSGEGKFINLQNDSSFQQNFYLSKSSYQGEECLQMTLPYMLEEDRDVSSRESRQHAETLLFSQENKPHFFALLKEELEANNWLLGVVIKDYLRIWGQFGVTVFEDYMETIARQLKSQFAEAPIVRYSDNSFFLVINDCDITTIERIGTLVVDTVEKLEFSFHNENISSSVDFSYSSLAIPETELNQLFGTIEDNLQILPVNLWGQTRETETSLALDGEEKNTISPEEVVSIDDVLANNDEGDPLGIFSIIEEALTDSRIRVTYSPISALESQIRHRYLVGYDLFDVNGNIMALSKNLIYEEHHAIGGRLDLFLFNHALALLQEDYNQEKEVYLYLTGYLLKNSTFADTILSRVKDKPLILGVHKKYFESESQALNQFLKKAYTERIKLVIYGWDNDDFIQLVRPYMEQIDYLALDGKFVSRLSRLTDAQEKSNTLNTFKEIQAKNIILLAEEVNSPSTMAMVWEYAIPFATGRMFGQPLPNLDFNFEQLMM